MMIKYPLHKVAKDFKKGGQQTGGYRPEHQEKRVFSIYFISKMNQHDRHDGCRYHKASRSRKSLEGPCHFLA